MCVPVCEAEVIGIDAGSESEFMPPAMSDASSDSRAGLVVVDNFTVTFLVDNCIEW